MQGSVFTGINYFFRGLVFLKTPGLRRFIVIPLATNIILFAVLGAAVYGYVSQWYEDALSWLPDWLNFLSWILAPILWLLSGLLTGYASTLIVLILTSPFHALLAEKVEELVTGEAVPALEGISAALLQLPRGIFRELGKLVYYLPMAFGLLILSFIPLLNAAAPFLWFLLGAWMMSLQFVDYPMDNHRLSFRMVRQVCARRRLSSLGFGAVVALIAGIPIVNLVVIPAAVAGATLFWCEEGRQAAPSIDQ